MKNKVIVLGSVTYALKSKDILMQHGIKSYIERNKKTKEFGCGYALHIPSNFEKAELLIKQNNIRILAVIDKEVE